MGGRLDMLSNLDCMHAIKSQDKRIYGMLIEFLKDFDDSDRQVLIGFYAILEFEHNKN